MKLSYYVLILAVVSFGYMGCGEFEGDSSEEGLNKSSSALTVEEAAALDACLEEVKTCRLSRTPDSEECREIYACVPDRPVMKGDRDEDARRFCEAVEERCGVSGTEVEDCDLLMERCLGDRIDSDKATDGVEQPVPTAEECMDGCLAAGAGEADCDERCAELE